MLVDRSTHGDKNHYDINVNGDVDDFVLISCIPFGCQYLIQMIIKIMPSKCFNVVCHGDCSLYDATFKSNLGSRRQSLTAHGDDKC